MKTKNALDYIADQGRDSRTIMFNAIMGALSVFSIAIIPIIEPTSPILAKLAQPTLLFISSIGGVILYGLTQKKRSEGGYDHLDERNNDV